jgi:hypothetical protein
MALWVWQTRRWRNRAAPSVPSDGDARLALCLGCAERTMARPASPEDIQAAGSSPQSSRSSESRPDPWTVGRTHHERQTPAELSPVRGFRRSPEPYARQQGHYRFSLRRLGVWAWFVTSSARVGQCRWFGRRCAWRRGTLCPAACTAAIVKVGSHLDESRCVRPGGGLSASAWAT